MKGKHGSQWTDEEYQFLRDNYGKLTHKQMASELGRGVPAVVSQITSLGLRRRWTKEEDYFLASHSDEGWPWCAQQLDRTAVSVRSRAVRIAKKQPQYKGVAWLAEDRAFLRDNRKRGVEWCAEQLKRTPADVLQEAMAIAIHGNTTSAKTPSKNELVRLNALGLTTTEIGKAIGVSDECVRINLKQHGIAANKPSQEVRMATAKKEFKRRYGVDDLASAAKARRRMARRASVAIQSLRLSQDLKEWM